MFPTAPESYHVEVSHRDLASKPYRWEIYRGADPLPIERSAETFRSQGAAERAGREALIRRVSELKAPSAQGWT